MVLNAIYRLFYFKKSAPMLSEKTMSAQLIIARSAFRPDTVIDYKIPDWYDLSWAKNWENKLGSEHY